jgi:hypothetical protein
MPKAHVLQRFMDEDEPGVWSVEVADRFGDGEMELTIFYGPCGDPSPVICGSGGAGALPGTASRPR